jgi:hypothetical protein
MKNVLNSIKLQERGVYVQASTLGSLEALLDFLTQSKIPVSCCMVAMPACVPLPPPPQTVFWLKYWSSSQEGCDESISDVGA